MKNRLSRTLKTLFWVILLAMVILWLLPPSIQPPAAVPPAAPAPPPVSAPADPPASVPNDAPGGILGVFAWLWNLFAFGGMALQCLCCIVLPLAALLLFARDLRPRRG